MRLVCISDTHGYLLDPASIPDGDVLIHAGDITRTGRYIEEVEVANRFLSSLPHKHKIAIAGNHDWQFAKNNEAARRAFADVIYLQDEQVTLDGVTFYGSPWQPVFFDWAFNLYPDELAEKWALIPEHTDVLITHGPPRGILDSNREGIRCGCPSLLAALDRVEPRAHVFGHIHEGYGATRHKTVSGHEIQMVNASTCTSRYQPDNRPVVIDV